MMPPPVAAPAAAPCQGRLPDAPASDSPDRTGTADLAAAAGPFVNHLRAARGAAPGTAEQSEVDGDGRHPAAGRSPGGDAGDAPAAMVPDAIMALLGALVPPSAQLPPPAPETPGPVSVESNAGGDERRPACAPIGAGGGGTGTSPVMGSGPAGGTTPAPPAPAAVLAVAPPPPPRTERGESLALPAPSEGAEMETAPADGHAPSVGTAGQGDRSPATRISAPAAPDVSETLSPPAIETPTPPIPLAASGAMPSARAGETRQATAPADAAAGPEAAGARLTSAPATRAPAPTEERPAPMEAGRVPTASTASTARPPETPTPGGVQETARAGSNAERITGGGPGRESYRDPDVPVREIPVGARGSAVAGSGDPVRPGDGESGAGGGRREDGAGSRPSRDVPARSAPEPREVGAVPPPPTEVGPLRSLDPSAPAEPALSAGSVREIAQAVRLSTAQGGLEVRLQLHPESLGEVQVHVRWEGGTLTARLEAATPAGREALEAGLPHLRAALRDQGIPVESLQVGMRLDLGARSHGNAFAYPQDPQQAPLPAARISAAPGAREGDEPVLAAPAGRLDVRI